MTKAEMVLKYLKGRKTPATQAQIAKGARVNPNTLRRILGGLRWNELESFEWDVICHDLGIVRNQTKHGLVYSLA